MNHLEFKALVKGLFLTQEQVRKLGGYKDQRQIRRFIAGEVKPHDDLVQTLKALDAKLDKVVSETINQAQKSGVDEIAVIGYKNQNDFEVWSDGSLPYLELHLCLLFRLWKASQDHGINFRIVPFDEESYIDFIDNNNLEDNQISMSIWSQSNNITY